MPGILSSNGKIKIASIFKLLMALAVVFAFMPSMLRIGGSRLSFAYLHIVFCVALLGLLLLRDGRLVNFYLQLARHNKLLFFSITALFVLHVVRYSITPEDGLMSRTLMALLVFTTIYLYFAFLFYLDSRNFYTFYRLISLGLIINLIAVGLSANGFQFIHNLNPESDRYAGLFSHPNQLAIVVTTVTVFYLANYFAETGISSRVKWAGMFIVALLLSILAGSKTNVLISCLILGIYLLWSVSFKNALIILLTAVVLILLFGYAGSSDLLLSLNPRLFSIVSELSFDNFMQYRTMQSRMEIWSYSWEAGTAYPFIGEGLGVVIRPDVPHSHNLLLEYLRIFGPVGLMFFCLFLFSLTTLIARGRNVTLDRHLLKVCKFSILAYLLVNMMSDSMGPQTVFFLAFFVAYLSVIPGNVYTLNPVGDSVMGAQASAATPSMRL